MKTLLSILILSAALPASASGMTITRPIVISDTLTAGAMIIAPAGSITIDKGSLLLASSSPACADGQYAGYSPSRPKCFTLQGSQITVPVPGPDDRGDGRLYFRFEQADRGKTQLYIATSPLTTGAECNLVIMHGEATDIDEVYNDAPRGIAQADGPPWTWTAKTGLGGFTIHNVPTGAFYMVLGNPGTTATGNDPVRIKIKVLPQ